MDLLEQTAVLTQPNETGEQPPSDKKKVTKLVALNLLLLAAVVAVVVLVLVPRMTNREPDLSSGDWVTRLAGDYLALPGVDFYDSAAITLTPLGISLHISYASQEDPAALQEQFLALLNNPSDFSEIESGILRITGGVEGGVVTINSYFQEICYIYDVVITLTDEKENNRLAELITQAYPVAQVEGHEILSTLIADSYGSFIFYEYDIFDALRYAGVPQYSRAYLYSGSVEDFDALAQSLAERDPNHTWDATNHMLRFEEQGYRYIVTMMQGEQSNLVSVSLQQIPIEASSAA